MRIATLPQRQKERTRTPNKHERPRQRPPGRSRGTSCSYSKRLDLLSELVNAVECLRVGYGEEPETGHSVRSDHTSRVWRVSDRLDEADLCKLILCYCSGTTARELAEQFTISKSSVKRLLRERDIRRTVPVITWRLRLRGSSRPCVCPGAA